MIYQFPSHHADLAQSYQHYGWAYQTSAELANKSQSGELDQAVAIIPLAAIEQHGPHLPLAVDAILNQAILAKACTLLPDHLPVFHVPMISVGMSLEHGSFSGTLSYHDQQLIDLIIQTALDVQKTGIQKILLWNSHGGNSPIMDLAAIRLRMQAKMAVVKTSWTRLTDLSDIFPQDEIKFGIHGGASETSLMMYLAPEMVRQHQVQNFPSTGQSARDQGKMIGPGGPAAFAWASEDLNQSGAIGNAALATIAAGEKIFERSGKELAKLLIEFTKCQVQPNEPWSGFGK